MRGRILDIVCEQSPGGELMEGYDCGVRDDSEVWPEPRLFEKEKPGEKTQSSVLGVENWRIWKVLGERARERLDRTLEVRGEVQAGDGRGE